MQALKVSSSSYSSSKGTEVRQDIREAMVPPQADRTLVLEQEHEESEHDELDYLSSGYYSSDGEEEEGQQNVIPAREGPDLISKQPDETLLQIMQYMNHSTLQNCKQVNRRFNILFDDRTLDRTLFRPGKRSQVLNPTNYNTNDVHINPILANIDVLQTDVDDCYMMDTARNHTNIRANATKGWLEMVTDPPMKSIRFSIGILPRICITSRYGVTVGQMVARICKVLAKDNRRRHTIGDIYHYPRAYGYGYPIPLTPANPSRIASNLEMLGRKPKWRGFSSKDKTRRREILVLESHVY